MIKIPFVKMVGAGNDFIVIEAQPKLDYTKLAKEACARQTGIGADGVLIFEKSKTSDYRMRIINADGSEAEMCGNGARCMAAYIVANDKPTKVLFGMETLAGEVLGEAQGELARVRLSNPKDYMAGLNITVAGRKMTVDHIDTGVPHTIVFVDGLQEVDVNTLGRLIRNHPRFAPRGTNVNFVEVASPAGGKSSNSMVAVRTYERGVEGETLACGTGAVAAAIVSYLHTHPKVKEQKGAVMKVSTTGKEILEITFDLHEGNKIDNVWLKGTAKVIARGEYYYHG
ncbi:MAG: diaminopimelate epimerase [Candidatus Omnitrophica bacterium]|nr:diaminopimelate epimerase [Candidatus Omnitrophota bacterium]